MSRRKRDESDEHSLGACCACEGTEMVRNILMLHQKSPTPGRGWGCVQCNLPADGASAVVCDTCLESQKPLRFASTGYPAKDGRIRIEELAGEHDHNYAYHPEAIHWFKDSPDAGHPDCHCSFCGELIPDLSDADPGPIRFTKGNLEARLHQKCFETVGAVFR